MENDFRQYITEEYEKVETAMEQREFVENLRFLMMTKEEDFTTYYSNRIVRKSNFYSTVDMLSRMFQVMRDYTRNESRVSEGNVEYAVNTHKLKVYAASSHNRKDVSQII